MLQRLLRWLGRSLFYSVEVRLNALENRLYSRMRGEGAQEFLNLILSLAYQALIGIQATS